MAEVKNDEITWILSLHDLATPEYQKAILRFKADSRATTDALNEQDEAYRRLCKTIIEYKELQNNAAKVWTQAEVAQERATRSMSNFMGPLSKHRMEIQQLSAKMEQLRVAHARLPWMSLQQGATNGGAAIKGLSGQIGMAVSMLGRMPGPLGGIGRAFGGIGRAISGVLGPVGSAVAVFTLAYNVTSKLVEALGLFPDPMEKVRRANQQARVEAEHVAEAFEKQRDVWIDTLEKEAAYADEAIAKADQQAAAYLRLQRAKEAVNKAVDDGIMLEMERAKYEDMLTVGGQYGAWKDIGGNVREGSPLAAAQVGAYHDVLMAQERQRRERERADRDMALAEEELAAKEATLDKAQRAKDKTNDEKEARADERVAEAQAEYDQWKGYYDRAYKAYQNLDPEDERDAKKFKARFSEMEDYKKKMDKAEAALNREKANRDRLLAISDRQENGVDSRQAEIDELRQQIEEKRKQRGNLDERQQFELAKLEDAYNKIVLDAQREEREEMERAIEEQAERERQLKEENDRIAHERAMQYAREEAAERARLAADANRQAEARLQAAQTQAARAWGFYRDPRKLVAYGREMDADAAAREQYRKDYFSLVHGRRGSLLAEAQNALREGGQERVEGLFTDWRRRKRLSVNEEATMRVALAEKEQEDAARAAIETRDILADIKDQITKLNTMEG